MIILDTNVVSEFMKGDLADPGLMDWLNDQGPETLFITSVTIAEILFGIEIMPPGRRKTLLRETFARMVDVFDERVLSFDPACALAFASCAAEARRASRGFPLPDGYIAAIAASRGFVVATRDTAPFQAGGVAVINPWNAQASK